MLEWIYLATCLFAAILIWQQRQTLPAKGGWILLAALVAQLLLEGSRWQMWPGYLAGGLALWWLIRSRPPKLLATLPLLLVALSGLLNYAAPVLRLIEPSGPYAVGTQDRQIGIREDRELAITIWYPSIEPRYPIARYWPENSASNATLAEGLGLPAAFGFLFSHLTQIKTHSYVDAAVAPGPFPLLVFSHGLNFGFSGQNRLLMEDLASHGYVVAAINHRDWDVATGSDNRIALQNLYAQERPPELETLAKRLAQPLPAIELRQQLARVAELRPQVHALLQKGLTEWREDQSGVISALTQPSNDALYRAIDPQRIGVFGMSFGGSTSLHTCSVDPRCRAGVNMDGLQTPDIELPPASVPFLFLVNADNHLTPLHHHLSTNASYLARIKGTQHLNFSDFSLFSPLLRDTPLSGEINPLLAINMTNSLVLTFFNHTLKGRGEGMLGQPSSFDQLELDRRLPGSTQTAE